MIYNYETSEVDPYPKTVITFQEKKVENVETLRFLGSQINFKEIGTGDVELDYRIQSANGKFHEFKNVFQNPRLHITTKMMYFNSLIRSRLCYASSSWCLTQRQYEKMDAAQRNLLRRMIRGGYVKNDDEDDEAWYVIGSEKLLQICKTTNLSEHIQKSQIKFAGHIVRSSNNNGSKCNLQ